jgi:hypothetical protein
LKGGERWASFDEATRNSGGCFSRLRRSKIAPTSPWVARANNRASILKALHESRPLLNSFGVIRLSLFGSFARDDGRADSDVDLLVEFDRPIGLFEFVRLQRQLGELLDHPVDLVTPEALKPQLRDRILLEAVLAA